MPYVGVYLCVCLCMHYINMSIRARRKQHYTNQKNVQYVKVYLYAGLCMHSISGNIHACVNHLGIQV